MAGVRHGVCELAFIGHHLLQMVPFEMVQWIEHFYHYQKHCVCGTFSSCY
jgi:hypothetical protein